MLVNCDVKITNVFLFFRSDCPSREPYILRLIKLIYNVARIELRCQFVQDRRLKNCDKLGQDILLHGDEL